jgi:hypothetical protein
MFSSLEANDFGILYSPGATEADASIMRFHIKNAEADFTTRRRTSTILSQCAELTQAQLPTLTAAAGTINIRQFVRDTDVADCVLDILLKIEEVAGDEEYSEEWIEKLRKVFLEGGVYRGTTVGEDGVISDIRDITYSPAPGGINWNAENEKDMLDLIDHITPAIKYEGFNPKVTRQTFIGGKTSNDAAARDLILCFAAYAHIGNNASKLAERRVDVTISKKLMDAVSAMGISKVNRTRTGLTLPRLAVAFMPEYLTYRLHLVTDLQEQTESTLAVFYQDVVFYGCPAIRNMGGYAEFHKEFSAYIYHKDASGDAKDEKFLKSYAQWNKVANKGYKMDTGIHTRMQTAIATTTSSKAAAYQFILAGVTEYASA